MTKRNVTKKNGCQDQKESAYCGPISTSQKKGDDTIYNRCFIFSGGFFSTHIKKVLKSWGIFDDFDDSFFPKCLYNHKQDIQDRLDQLSRIYTDIVNFLDHKAGPRWEDYLLNDVVLSDTRMRVLSTAKISTKGEGSEKLLWQIITQIIEDGCAEKEIPLSDIVNLSGDAKVSFSLSNNGASQAAKVLTIKSPIGSYKNRLLQYIYLYLCVVNLDRKIDFLPIYISATMAEDDPDKFEKKIKDLERLLSKLKDASIQTLLIIDNVRLFQCGINYVYSKINGIIQNFKCKIVVGADDLYSWNAKRTVLPDGSNLSPFKDPFQLYYCKDNGSNWMYTEGAVINISSMNLIGRKEKSINFIQACLTYFRTEGDWLNDINAGALYEGLIGKRKEIQVGVGDEIAISTDLQFYSLDAYLLLKILPMLQREPFGASLNMVMLYDEVFFGGESPNGDVALKAYTYEYSDANLEFDEQWWRVAKEHRSVLDYLIAEHYWALLKKMDFKGKFSFLELPQKVVLPKNVTRFLVQRINSDRQYVTDIVDGFEDPYNKLTATDYYRKSQVTYLFGRINLTNSDQRKAQITVLKRILEKENSLLEDAENDSEKKKQLFLLRTLSVSLIYLAEEGAFCSYIESILSEGNENLSRDINCGFHLEYYGDTPSYWEAQDGSYVHLNDNLEKGINTFRKLYIDINNRFDLIQQAETLLDTKELYVLTLQLSTFNNLIDSRVNKKRIMAVSESEDFRKQCLVLNKRFLTLMDEVYSILNEETQRCLDSVRNYILENSLRLLESLKPNEQKVDTDYNEINKALNTVRTGWINRGIVPERCGLKSKGSCPESIFAHMYQCWLIGYIFLPNGDDEDSYNKQKILELLLIHDLGESSIGDVCSGEKREGDKTQEEETLKKILEKAKDPQKDEKIKLWKDSETLAGEANINARIAKEIDKIQALYQYCRYCVNRQINFKSAEWTQSHGGESTQGRYWRDDIEATVSSKIGKRILWTLVLNNQVFIKSQNEELEEAIMKWRREVLEKAIKGWDGNAI